MARRSPRRSRSCGSGKVSRSSPSKRMRPLTSEVRAGSRPITARKVTLLPQPDSPTTPRVRPRRTASETPSTARVVRPASPWKVTLRLPISRRGAESLRARSPPPCGEGVGVARLDEAADISPLLPPTPTLPHKGGGSAGAVPLPLSPRGVALHAARVGGGAAAAADAGGGGQAAFRPGRSGLDGVAAALELVAGRGGHAAFHHQHAGP